MFIMRVRGISVLICLMAINIFHKCNAKCDEYIIIFQEELPCHGYPYILNPIKLHDVKWNNLTYPCNSTEVYEEIKINKECILEIDCSGCEATCFDKIKTTNNARHSLIHEKPTVPHYKNKTDKIRAPEVNIGNKNGTNDSDAPKINTGDVKKLIHIKNEKTNKLIYNVTIIYVNENNMLNNSELIDKIKNNSIVYCDHAETVCIKKKNASLKDISNDNTTLHSKTLNITLKRDETSPIQPIFTGYFPQFFNEFNKEKIINSPFDGLKTVTLTCHQFLAGHNCKEYYGNNTIKQINVYVKSNYIQNNTTTKYPNCITDYNDIDNSLELECDAQAFAYNNQYILPPPKPTNETLIKPNNKTNQDNFLDLQDLFFCQFTYSNDILSNNPINLKECFNNRTENNLGNSSIVETIDKNINNVTTNDIKLNKTKLSGKETEINKDKLAYSNENKIIAIHIIENGHNCSQNSSFTIREGQIFDLGKNRKNILETKIMELNVSNCINRQSNLLNNTHSQQQTELVIIVANYSLPTITYLFKRMPKKANITKRIILKCDYINNNLNNDTIQSKTGLKCESVDFCESFNTTNLGKDKDLIHISKTRNNTTSLQNNAGSDNKSNTSDNTMDEKTNVDKIEKKQTQVPTEINTNNNCSLNNTNAANGCNIKKNENTRQIEENKEKRNDTDGKLKENKEVENDSQYGVGKHKSNHINDGTVQTFNRRKDLPKNLGQRSTSVESDEKITRIILIAITSIAGVVLSIVFFLILEECCKKKEYRLAPTAPTNEEETPF